MCQTNIELFCQAVLQDRALQGRLRAVPDQAQFCSAVVVEAQRLGLAFSLEDAMAVIHAKRRAWFERFCSFVDRPMGAPQGQVRLPADSSNEPLPVSVSQLAGFIPIGVYWLEGKPMVDWCYLGEERFTDSFFDQTISRLLRLPFNQFIRPQTPVEALVELQTSRPGLQPAGFIFHMSRCGSTLVSQMLAALPGNIVISEAGPIDVILRSHTQMPELSEEQQVAWLRGVVNALAQPNQTNQTGFFIKFDCINTLQLPLLRKAFPDVPWIFVYRNPVEVLVSQIRQRGGLLLPGALEPALMGWDVSRLQELSLNEYTAALLEKICEAAIDYFDPKMGMLVEYTQLPAVLSTLIADHFCLKFSSEEKKSLDQASHFHAKNPYFEFTADGESKRKEASSETNQLAERFLSASYARLEALRCSLKP